MIPVILSGGSGTRLWPVSRASNPKQFCEFFDGSFLGQTIKRLKPFGEVHILTTRSMEGLTKRLSMAESMNPKGLLFEPMAKNTGPAIALLCHILNLRGQGDEVAGVFPSDHLVANEARFKEAVHLAESVARKGLICTLGIRPHSPETGYGYIEINGGSKPILSENGMNAQSVVGFREKPSQQKAEEYVKSGQYLWNAGMFVFQVKDMIAAFKKFQPEMWRKISEISEDLSNAEYKYALIESISVDYAIMEKLSEQACVPCDMGWSDVGSWDEMARLTDESTSLVSRSRAEVFNVHSENNYVFSVHDKVVGLIDVTDILVVDTPDALLVARKGSSQKVKELVSALREAGQPEATDHPFESRPWGKFEILADEPEYKAKKISIDVGAQLSYQSHKHRREHWVVVSGEAEVVLDEKTHKLTPGQSIMIPSGSKHRMRNSGQVPLIFVEVQTGEYFGEDDITRYQDDYDRV